MNNIIQYSTMSSITLSGSESSLTADFFPPIELKGGSHVCGLIDFQTYNSVPNIDHGCNKFYWKSDEVRVFGQGSEIFADVNEITVPTGSYEIKDLSDYLEQALSHLGVTLNVRVNKNTFRSEIKCSHEINFEHEDSVASLFGFNKCKLPANVLHISDKHININRINVIRIECNIISGAYINNLRSHTLHEFYPAVAPGYKIVEVPTNVIYLPVTVKTIHSITLNIVDQSGHLINFRGETITIRIHIKRDS